jgi:hypothetical protein
MTRRGCVDRRIIPRVFLYTAHVAWALAMAGLVRDLFGPKRVA